MRVLLVEDDPQLGNTLKRALEHEGYIADWVTSAERAINSLLESDLDLVILDWMLPGRSGVELLQELRRRQCPIPILMLTANIGTQAKVQGLDAGADDYLTKPFDLDELMARLRALARRRAVRPSNRLSHGALTLDIDRSELSIDGRTVILSHHELKILQLLMENAGRYVAKTRLEEYLSGWGEPVTLNAIEAHVCRLRKRIGAKRIVTLRGVGYKVNGE
ncbi:MAG: response regulator transcription factor [Candidatus Competibacterales bacterium]